MVAGETAVQIPMNKYNEGVVFARAQTDVRAGDIVRTTKTGVVFDRRPTAKNPCNPESLVCVCSARAGGLCEYVVNGLLP